MNRRYFISNSLADLERLERELIDSGIDAPQLHVYTHDETAAASATLHDVSSLGKRDMVHSGLKGFVLGALGAIVLLLCAYAAGWTDSAAGWAPFIFLAIVVFGFSAWEGGLRGIQEPNHEFERFNEALAQDKHIFFLDIDGGQQGIVDSILANHPTLEYAGDGAAAPSWLVHGQANFQKFIKAMP